MESKPKRKMKVINNYYDEEVPQTPAPVTTQNQI